MTVKRKPVKWKYPSKELLLTPRIQDTPEWREHLEAIGAFGDGPDDIDYYEDDENYPEGCPFGGAISSGTEECDFCAWNDFCSEAAKLTRRQSDEP